ncbi:hypothetical protein D3C78_1383650 [compost metagenome]
MVAGNHNRLDSRSATGRNRILHLTTRRIDHSGQADKNELGFSFVFRIAFIACPQILISETKYSQRGLRHRLVCLRALAL